MGCVISQLCSFDDDDEEEEEGDDAGKAAETNSSVIAGLMEKKASGEILTVVPPDDGAMKQGVPIIVDLAFVSIFPLLFQSHSFYTEILRVSGIQCQVPRRSRASRGKR